MISSDIFIVVVLTDEKKIKFCHFVEVKVRIRGATDGPSRLHKFINKNMK